MYGAERDPRNTVAAVGAVAADAPLVSTVSAADLFGQIKVHAP